MDDKDSWGHFFLDLVLCVTNFVLGAITVMRLWGWFIAPLGMPELGLLHAAGLRALVEFMTYGQVVSDDTDNTVKTAVRIVFALSTLFMGWLIHVMM